MVDTRIKLGAWKIQIEAQWRHKKSAKYYEIATALRLWSIEGLASADHEKGS